jgi:hypothetical protein
VNDTPRKNEQTQRNLCRYCQNYEKKRNRMENERYPKSYLGKYGKEEVVVRDGKKNSKQVTENI